VTKPRALNDRSLAYKVVGTQALIALLVPILFLLSNKEAAYCALIGGWIATLSNLYFAIQAFRHSGARAAQQIVRSFNRGESGKFIITIVLLVIAFKRLPELHDQNNALAMFISFVAVHLVAWLAPAVLRR